MTKKNRWKELFEHEYSIYHKTNNKEDCVLNVDIVKNKELIDIDSQDFINQVLETTEKYFYA